MRERGAFQPSALAMLRRPRAGAPDPRGGPLRAARAAVLAALCVLLPLLGHRLAEGHAPASWTAVASFAVAAALGSAPLTRRRLTDTQLLVALGAAQLAYCLVCVMTEACAARCGPAAAQSGPLGWIEHPDATGGPSWAVPAAQAVAVVIASRTLGATEALLWQTRTALAWTWQLLSILWPGTTGAARPAPSPQDRDEDSGPRSALLVRLNAGRAPPRPRRALLLPALSPLRPMPAGGPSLP